MHLFLRSCPHCHHSHLHLGLFCLPPCHQLCLLRLLSVAHHLGPALLPTMRAGNVLLLISMPAPPPSLGGGGEASQQSALCGDFCFLQHKSNTIQCPKASKQVKLCGILSPLPQVFAEVVWLSCCLDHASLLTSNCSLLSLCCSPS